LVDHFISIGTRNSFFVQPPQNCLAPLHHGAFTLECNCLMVAGGTASPASAGSACKLPGAYGSVPS
jgi:hypothetical protein